MSFQNNIHYELHAIRPDHNASKFLKLIFSNNKENLNNFINCISRYLTEKQRALVTALAELDEDLQGTVNGVSENNKTKGEIFSRKRMYHRINKIQKINRTEKVYTCL